MQGLDYPTLSPDIGSRSARLTRNVDRSSYDAEADSSVLATEQRFPDEAERGCR